MRRSDLKKRYDNAWLRGYAAAMGNILRNWNERSLVEQAMIADGVTIDDFQKAGVEPFDLQEIRRALPRTSAARTRPRPKPGDKSILLSRRIDLGEVTELRQILPETVERVKQMERGRYPR